MATILFANLPQGLQINTDLLCQFEENLDPQNPTENKFTCRILGYGEISTVFEIQEAGFEGIALKRMSIFENIVEVEQYRHLYDLYLQILEDEVGLNFPINGYVGCLREDGSPIFYILQKMVLAEAFGNKALASLPEKESEKFLIDVLEQLKLVWTFNQHKEDVQIAVDGQISNWALAQFAGNSGSIPHNEHLLYLDTSTPMLRLEGVEQLDTELFLRAAPSFLRWVLRLFFVDEVMERYYIPRLVLVDLGANFYKDKLIEWVPTYLALANKELEKMNIDEENKPINESELRSYIRQDQIIWKTYMGMRRLDQFLHIHLLRREYPYILPPRNTG